MNPGSSSARRPFSAEPGIGTLLDLCSQHTKLSNLGIACQQNNKKKDQLVKLECHYDLLSSAKGNFMAKNAN